MSFTMLETCPGCNREHDTEFDLLRCFESHPCYYCGGPMDRDAWNLTPGAGMLWCGCRDEEG